MSRRAVSEVRGLATVKAALLPKSRLRRRPPSPRQPAAQAERQCACVELDVPQAAPLAAQHKGCNEAVADICEEGCTQDVRSVELQLQPLHMASRTGRQPRAAGKGALRKALPPRLDIAMSR